MSSTIPPEKVVFRAIKKSRWIVDGNPQPDIFLRELDEEDLSLLTEVSCSTEHCSATFKSCFGEVSILAKSFIDMGFEVTATPIAESYPYPAIPHHASVYGMPMKDEAEARNAAIELIEKILTVNQNRYKRKDPK